MKLRRNTPVLKNRDLRVGDPVAVRTKILIPYGNELECIPADVHWWRHRPRELPHQRRNGSKNRNTDPFHRRRAGTQWPCTAPSVRRRGHTLNLPHIRGRDHDDSERLRRTRNAKWTGSPARPGNFNDVTHNISRNVFLSPTSGSVLSTERPQRGTSSKQLPRGQSALRKGESRFRALSTRGYRYTQN